MFLSARHKPTQKEAIQSIVIDLDTGMKIDRVVWANTDTGRYRKILTDQDGKIIFDRKTGKIASKIFKGNIEIRRKYAI